MSPSPLRLSLLSDRQKYPPEGLAGGGKGAAVEIKLQDGSRPHPKSRGSLDPGDRLTLRFAGGGGFGDPTKRDKAAIVADVRDGYVSADAASRLYGAEM